MDKKSIMNLEFYKITELLLEQLDTQIGAELAKKIRISSSYDEVIALQSETSEAQKLILEGNGIHIEGLVNIYDKMRLAKIGAMLDPLSLLHVAGNLRQARIVSDRLSEREDVPILFEKSKRLFRFRELEEKITAIILSEAEISDHASPVLRQLRREIKNIKDKIKTKLDQIVSSESNMKYLQDSIVTQRQDRYVIPVKTEYKSNFPGIVHDTSSSGATVFIEPMAVVEMNNGLRIARQKEKEEIERILLELSLEVGACYDPILQNQEILGYFDFVMGKGRLSVKMNAISPKVNQNKRIHLVNAKHPLLEATTVVPLNIHLGNKYGVLVITGPNTGGKTVALKTVGLFVLMAQAGLHIPCDYGSTVSVFDNVFTDIGDDQSISQNLSTFSAHMVNIVRILKKATKRSLLLLDELGSGTDPDEGSALAIAILDHLKDLKCLTVATTHYSNLKHYALNTEFVENASVEFDVETLSPTYRLLIGIPGKSNAFYISQKLGLDGKIIESAKRHLSEDTVAMEDILLKIEKDRLRIEQEREAIDTTSENIRNRLANIERKERRLESNKEQILKEAKKEAQKIVLDVKKQSEEIIRKLRELEANSLSLNNRDIERLRLEISEMENASATKEELFQFEESARSVDVEELSVGDQIYASPFRRNATIVSIDKKRKQVVAQMDNMKINLPFGALQGPAAKKDPVQKTGLGSIYKSKSASIKTEVDLRGMNMEQAADELLKYLDDAYLSNIQTITIIHGIGTGVLKNGVDALLKSIKYIKSYRPGSYGEGGAGVTIVQFR